MRTLARRASLLILLLVPTGAWAEAASELLDPTLSWGAGNREALERALADLGTGGPAHDPQRPPVAVFDWDNTVIKNDIGDGSVFWMLRNDAFLSPADGWAATSRFLAPAAIEALDAACGEHAAGRPLPTSVDLDCADEILSVYEDKRTAAGVPAWLQEGYDRCRIVPALAWVAQLQAGRTPEEMRALARQAIEANLAAAEGAVQQVGTRTGMVAWIRIYPQIRDLIGALQARGFDVWVASASPELVVQAFAEHVGIAHDHVIGIRTLVDEAGLLTHRLAGCGPVADGDDGIMTYKEGKRCFIAQEVFGDDSAAAVDPQHDPTRRPAFVAGDAQTDISMLLDAVHLRLVIDRQRSEVMCHALNGTGGTWLVNPMFIGPAQPRSEPYPCSTTGCADRAGNPVPCVDPGAGIIPDQAPR